MLQIVIYFHISLQNIDNLVHIDAVDNRMNTILIGKKNFTYFSYDFLRTLPTRGPHGPQFSASVHQPSEDTKRNRMQNCFTLFALYRIYIILSAFIEKQPFSLTFAWDQSDSFVLLVSLNPQKYVLR